MCVNAAERDGNIETTVFEQLYQICAFIFNLFTVRVMQTSVYLLYKRIIYIITGQITEVNGKANKVVKGEK